MWAMGHKLCLIAAAVVSRRHSAGILGTTRASAFLKGRKLASLGHVLFCKVVTAAFLQGCVAKCLLCTACSGEESCNPTVCRGELKQRKAMRFMQGHRVEASAPDMSRDWIRTLQIL